MADINPVNNPMGALQQMATAPMNQLLAQQQQGHAQHQAQLQNVQQAISAAPEADEAERWGAMAMGAAKAPPVVGGFGMMLANIGGAYGQTLASQKQREVERQALLAKLMEAGQMGAGSMTAMTQAALNPFLNVPGVGLVRRTDAAMTLPSNMVPEYNKLYSAFYKEATEQKMPNPEEWARQQASAQLGYATGRSDIAGGRTNPPTAQTTAGGAQSSPAQDFDVKLKPGTDTDALVKQLKFNEDKAVADQDFARAKELQALRLRVESGSYQPTASPLEYKDTRTAEFKKEWGGKEAATLEKALTEASGTLSKSSNLVSTLNTLEGLLNIDNMPEGKFAPILVESQSALKSLGVDIKGPVGPAQVANALANEMALRLRTGGGENLMPGQMSNFDAQLLLSMAPTLSQTKEGRNMLLNFMREAADSQRRIAEAAQEFAAANNGMLTPEWRKTAADMERVEMAKRELARRRVMKQFGGK